MPVLHGDCGKQYNAEAAYVSGGLGLAHQAIAHAFQASDFAPGTARMYFSVTHIRICPYEQLISRFLSYILRIEALS